MDPFFVSHFHLSRGEEKGLCSATTLVYIEVMTLEWNLQEKCPNQVNHKAFRMFSTTPQGIVELGQSKIDSINKRRSETVINQ